MVFGLNFNGTQIPANAKRHFAERRKFNGHNSWFLLAGVCETKAEQNAMVVTANNGKRKMVTVSRGKWYAVYVGY